MKKRKVKHENRKSYTYLTRLIQKLAPKVGARVVVEPEWGHNAQIIYPNGVVRSVRLYSLDLNHIASADIAKDKDFAKFFIKKLGYPVAEGKTIFKDSWAKAIKSNRTISYGVSYAKKLGYPLIVKPNSKSQGAGVILVWNQNELKHALREVFEDERIGIIERYLPGKDYRVVVLGNDVISAYERIALSVTGDGKHPILALLKQKQKAWVKLGRDTQINFQDKRFSTKLRRLGHAFNTILKKDEKVYLLDNANLSTGGDSLDVTEKINPGFKKIAVDVTKKMGLRIAGVDIMVISGDITKAPTKNNYYIIEINAAPGLDHYVTTGPAQKKIVEDMYLKVLKALGKKD